MAQAQQVGGQHLGDSQLNQLYRQWAICERYVKGFLVRVWRYWSILSSVLLHFVIEFNKPSWRRDTSRFWKGATDGEGGSSLSVSHGRHWGRLPEWNTGLIWEWRDTKCWVAADRTRASWRVERGWTWWSWTIDGMCEIWWPWGSNSKVWVVQVVRNFPGKEDHIGVGKRFFPYPEMVLIVLSLCWRSHAVWRKCMAICVVWVQILPLLTK